MNKFELRHEIAWQALQFQTRRQFLGFAAGGLGAIWLGLQSQAAASPNDGPNHEHAVDRPGSRSGHVRPHFAAKAKRVIFLHMAGAPSQLELFDYKPELATLDGKPCPQSFLAGARFAFITGIPNMLGPRHPFQQAGESGAWITDLLPNFARVVDDVCFIKSMHTDQFNHAPAQLLLQTGNQNLGAASMGAWITYGLGTENENLPGFIALVSGGNKPDAGKSAWGSGFLPSIYQGVQCRGQGDPILYLSSPEHVDHMTRRAQLDAITALNRQAYETVGDPEILTRIEQYELAFRMQTSAQEAFNLGLESQATLDLYGAKPGEESFANNCLLARRLAERGVRFIELFDWGWDHHGTNVENDCRVGMRKKCGEIDKPITALIEDLKRAGLYEETLIVWAGEFGRTPMKENRAGNENAGEGRDHHRDAFTIWLGGGGVKGGLSFGATDPIGYRAVESPVSIHDLHATILRLLGYDHRRFTYPIQGLEQRLTNVTKPSQVVEAILA